MARPRRILALCALLAAFGLPLQANAESAAEVTAEATEIPEGIAGAAQADATAEADVGDASAEAIEQLDYDPLFDEEEAEFAENEVYDPLEPGNRAVYGFNRNVSRLVWDPITAGYRFVIPAPARRAVRRVFDNLNAPIYVANHLLQLEPVRAVETLGAFAMNVTFGVGGLFDTASGVNLELKATDCGETLALVGVGPGPYLMLPLMGPTTLRDGIGFVIDRGFHPATYFFGIPFQLVGYGGIGFAAMEEALDDLTALEESALDPYAVLRSAYMQAREKSIADLRNPPAPKAPEDSPGASLASGSRHL